MDSNMDENSNSQSSSGSVELKSEYVNGHMDTEYIEEVSDDGQPILQIVEEPQQRGFRFRYECEGPSHGGLQGNNSEKFRKTVPTIRIRNYSGPARVKVSLVTDEPVPKPHAHKLVGKHCKDGICTNEVRPGTTQVAFPNLCIQHVTRKKAAEVLQQRIMEEMILMKRLQLGDYNCQISLAEEEKQQAHKEAVSSAKSMQLNVVRLRFQAFLLDEAGNVTQLLSDVVSMPIFDSKSPGANALKICRMDKYSGCCTGNEEVFLLCEKVQREDISVRFVEQDKDGRTIWSAYGNFGPCDVHRQYAIVFKTPEYRDTEIKSPVNVLVMLQRKSDKESSDPKSFTYYPKTLDKEEIYRKRKKTFPWSGGGGNYNNTFDPPGHFGGGHDKSNGSSNGDNSNGLPNGGTIPDLENLSQIHFGNRPPIRLNKAGNRPFQQARRLNRPSQSIPQAAHSVDIIENPSQFMFEEVSHLSPMSATGQMNGGTSPPYINGGSPNSMNPGSLQSVTSPYNSGNNMSSSPHSTAGSLSSPYHQGAVSPQLNPTSPHSNNRSPNEMMDPSKFCTQASSIGVPLTSTIAESIPDTQNTLASTFTNQMEACFPSEATCENFNQLVPSDQGRDLETDFFQTVPEVQFYSQFNQPMRYNTQPNQCQTLPEIEQELANIMQIYGHQGTDMGQLQTCSFQARGVSSTNYIQGLDDITGLDTFDGRRKLKTVPTVGLDEVDSALVKPPEISRHDYEVQIEASAGLRKDIKPVLLSSAKVPDATHVPIATVTIDTGTQAGGGETKDTAVQTEMDTTMMIVTKTAEALQTYAASGDVRALLMVQRFLMTVSDINGDLPLHTSLINLKYEVFQNLLDVMITLPDFQARINAYNYLHQTPLHLAVITNQPGSIDLLLRAGADPGLLDRNGRTAAYLAVLYKRDSCLKNLLQYLRPNVSSKCPFPELNTKCFDGYTPAHIAAQTDNLTAMKLLVYGRADINLPDGKSGKTPLHHVVEADELSIAAYLILQAGAEVNKKSFDGNTPLHIACGRGNVGMVALLMAGGADPNIENDEVESDGSDKEEVSDGVEERKETEKDADKDTDASEEKSNEMGEDSVEPKILSRSRSGRGLRPEDFADCNDKIIRILNGEPYTSLKEDHSDEDDNSAEPVREKLRSLKYSHGHESGLGSLNIGSIKGDMERVGFFTRKNLSDILDRPGKSDWRDLASRLGLTKCMEGYLGYHSPTRLLLTYYEANGGTVSKLAEALEDMHLTEAAHLLETLETTTLQPNKSEAKDEAIDSGVEESIKQKSQLSA